MYEKSNIHLFTWLFLCICIIITSLFFTREAQIEMKKHEIKDTEMRKKINLNSVEWADNPDRYLLELAGSRPSYAQYDKKTQGKQSTN